MIRNRVIQFLVNETFITAAPDAAIYGESYPDTNRKLEAFEELAKERAKEGKHTAGFMRVYSVVLDGIHRGVENWKNRINHFVTPFQYCGAPIHDFQIAVFEEGRWQPLTPRSGHYVHLDFENEWDFKLDLKILHYHPLFRPNPETTEFTPHHRDEIENLEKHPHHYIEKMLT